MTFVWAALISCKGTEALKERTEHIKTELISDTSRHILMQTHLSGLDYG